MMNGVSTDMIETKSLSELPVLIVAKNRENSLLGRNVYVREIVPVIVHTFTDLDRQ